MLQLLSVDRVTGEDSFIHRVVASLLGALESIVALTGCFSAAKPQLCCIKNLISQLRWRPCGQPYQLALRLVAPIRVALEYSKLKLYRFACVFGMRSVQFLRLSKSVTAVNNHVVGRNVICFRYRFRFS